MSDVTRLTVIDHRADGQGRLFEARDCTVRTQLQDDGLTLKVWVTDRPDEESPVDTRQDPGAWTVDKA